MYCVDFVADKVVSGGRDKHLKMWGQTSFGCFVFTDCMTVDGRTENETVGPIPLCLGLSLTDWTKPTRCSTQYITIYEFDN